MNKTIVKYRHTIFALIMIVLNCAGASASAQWTVDPSDYRYDMSLYLDVSFADSEMDYSLYEVGAFCGDECRGVAEVLPLSDDHSCLYMRVRSNQASGETMTFRYYDKSTQTTAEVENVSFTFESNSMLGYPSEPYDVKIILYYDVTLSAGAGGTINTDGGHLADGTELTLSATPDEGYHFERWSDGSIENPRTIIVSENLALTAEFGVNTYRLTYMVDGTVYKEYTVDYGATITAEAYPDKEGHTFAGWEGLPATMPAHDVTVNGAFTVNVYKLTLYLNDLVYSSEDVEYGTKLYIETPDVPEGCHFDGWSEEIPETMPAHDLDIHGTYTTSAASIVIDTDDKVTIYSMSGNRICNDKRRNEIVDQLANGVYIINGQKVIIRR